MQNSKINFKSKTAITENNNNNNNNNEKNF